MRRLAVNGTKVGFLSTFFDWSLSDLASDEMSHCSKLQAVWSNSSPQVLQSIIIWFIQIHKYTNTNTHLFAEHLTSFKTHLNTL